MNQIFKEWHKNNLIEFIEFFRKNYTKEFNQVMESYNSWLRGN